MQKQEDFKLMKSGEGDGRFYRVKSSATVDIKSTPFDRSPIKRRSRCPSSRQETVIRSRRFSIPNSPARACMGKSDHAGGTNWGQPPEADFAVFPGNATSTSSLSWQVEA